MAAAKSYGNLTFSALLSAVIVSLMSMTRFVSIADYSVCLLCSLLIGVIVLECGYKWALAAYCVSGGLGLVLGNVECSLLFLALFGYYPIVKPTLERLPRLLEWVVKLVAFNGVMIALYAFVDAFIAPVLTESQWNPYLQIAILLTIANAAFILFDLVFDRVMTLYFVRLHPRIHNMKRGR